MPWRSDNVKLSFRRDKRHFNGADIRLGVGSDGHKNYGFTVNRVLTDNIASRFSLYAKETDGFITNSISGKDRGNED